MTIGTIVLVGMLIFLDIKTSWCCNITKLKYFSSTNELTVQYNCEVAIYYSVIMAPHTASLDRPEEWVLSCQHGIKYGSTTINCACPPLCAQPTIFLNIDFKGTMLEGGFWSTLGSWIAYSYWMNSKFPLVYRMTLNGLKGVCHEISDIYFIWAGKQDKVF